jgi:hypothetical protein
MILGAFLITVQGLTPSCGSTCTKGNVYSIGIDTQRYCLHCSKWFHVTCLETADEQCKGIALELDERVLAKAPRDLAKICRMPIERSARSEFGNGAMLSKALDLLMARQKNWRSIMGEDLVQKILQDQEYSVFHCAQCDNLL